LRNQAILKNKNKLKKPVRFFNLSGFNLAKVSKFYQKILPMPLKNVPVMPNTNKTTPTMSKGKSIIMPIGISTKPAITKASKPPKDFGNFFIHHFGESSLFPR
jgi:hypothetical protein